MASTNEVKVVSNITYVRKATDKAMKKAARMIGGTVAGHAVEACPVDTGLLRNSITFALGGEAPEIISYQSNDRDKNGKLAGAEIELVNVMSRETRLKKALAKVQNDYDYIFIDCPPSLGLLTLNALSAADSVLMPIQCEFYALEGVSQLMNTIKLVRENLNPELEVEGVLMTMYDSRTRLSEQVVAEVRQAFGEKVYNTLIPRTVRLSEAPSYGQPILAYDRRSKGSEVYLELAKEVIDRGSK